MPKPSYGETNYRSRCACRIVLDCPLVAVLYLANRVAGLAFPPFDAFDWLRDKIPGGFLNPGIEALARCQSAENPGGSFPSGAAGIHRLKKKLQ